jgi:hypothetical protein
MLTSAAAALEAVNADHRKHCDAVRAVGEECSETAGDARRLHDDLGLA